MQSKTDLRYFWYFPGFFKTWRHCEKKN